MKRIIVIGDSAMGKTTFATKLSQKIRIVKYSTDDIYYEKKFTRKRKDDEIQKLVQQTFAKKQWIVEGTTRRILSKGLDKADMIFYFKSTSLLRQYWYLFTRKDENQDLLNLLSLAKYLFLKHFQIGAAKKISYEKLLEPYTEKVIVFTHFRQADEWLSKDIYTVK